MVFYPTELEELNWMRLPSNERSKVRRRKRMKKKKRKRKEQKKRKRKKRKKKKKTRKRKRKRRKHKGLYGSADAGQEMTSKALYGAFSRFGYHHYQGQRDYLNI